MIEEAVREVIEAEPVATQGAIVAALKARGLTATQSSVSRALARIDAVKLPDGAGGVRYRLRPAAAPQPQSLVDRITENGMMVIIKTRPGAANHIAAVIDGARVPGIAGTIAGDDTIFIAPEAEVPSAELCGTLSALLLAGPA